LNGGWLTGSIFLPVLANVPTSGALSD